MKQIEPGCLCLVVGARTRRELIGASVTALRLVKKGEVATTDWICPQVGRPYVFAGNFVPAAWLCSGPSIDGFALVAPNHLLRIDGHEPEQAAEQKKEVSTC